MKTRCVLMFAAFGLLIAPMYGDSPKNYRIELSGANIGTVELTAGEYKMLVHRDGDEPKVRLTEVRTGNVIDIAAKVESGDKKFERTEVHSRQVNGATQISEIRIGGTTFRIDFQQGS